MTQHSRQTWKSRYGYFDQFSFYFDLGAAYVASLKWVLGRYDAPELSF